MVGQALALVTRSRTVKRCHEEHKNTNKNLETLCRSSVMVFRHEIFIVLLFSPAFLLLLLLLAFLVESNSELPHPRLGLGQLSR